MSSVDLRYPVGPFQFGLPVSGQERALYLTQVAEAPSLLRIVGRYILPAEIFIELDRKEKGAGGEIQLTDSMQKLIGRHPFHAVEAKCEWYDCGDKVGFLEGNIAVALTRPDIAPSLRAFLKNLKN